MSMSAVSEKGKTEKKDEELKVKGSKRGRRRKRMNQAQRPSTAINKTNQRKERDEDWEEGPQGT